MRLDIFTFVLLPACLVRAAHRGAGVSSWDAISQAKGAWQAAAGVVSTHDRSITLRVTAPTVITGTLFWRERADGTIDPEGEVWKGPVWDMLQYFETANSNVRLIRQNVSAEAIAASPDPTSSWWGCAYMVATNQTEVCVGDYWISSDYREFMEPVGTFTHSFDTEPSYLVIGGFNNTDRLGIIRRPSESDSSDWSDGSTWSYKNGHYRLRVPLPHSPIMPGATSIAGAWPS